MNIRSPRSRFKRFVRLAACLPVVVACLSTATAAAPSATELGRAVTIRCLAYEQSSPDDYSLYRFGSALLSHLDLLKAKRNQHIDLVLAPLDSLAPDGKADMILTSTATAAGVSVSVQLSDGNRITDSIPAPGFLSADNSMRLAQTLARKIESHIDGVSIRRSAPEILPVLVIVDSSFASARGLGWKRDAHELLTFASRALERDIDYEAMPVALVEISLRGPVHPTLDELHQSLVEHSAGPGDTVTLLLTQRRLAHRSGIASDYEQIGMADYEDRLILLNCIDDSLPDDPDFWLLYNGAALIHEFGHLLGCIHVNDLGSVMNPTIDWAVSTRYDSFNVQVARSQAEGRRGTDQLLVGILNDLDTPHGRLVDIVALTNQFAESRGDSPAGLSPLFEIGRLAQLLADNQRDSALSLVDRLIRQFPKQAALYFYRAGISREGQYENLVTAARLGHWEARKLLTEQR